MMLSSVNDLLRESEHMLDEVLRIRGIIQQSKDESAAELLRRIRYEAAAAHFVPMDLVTNQQLEENAKLLDNTVENSEDLLPEIRLTEEEIQQYERELESLATGGLDVTTKTRVKEIGPKTGSRSGKQSKTHTSTRSAVKGNASRVCDANSVLSSASSVSTDLNELSTDSKTSLVLLSEIRGELQQSDLLLEKNLSEDGENSQSQEHEIDELLDGLLDYHEKLERNRANEYGGKAFQTELPTIDEMDTTTSISQVSYQDGSFPPKPHYSKSNIYSRTTMLTEEEDARITRLIEEGLPEINAFQPSSEELRRDAEICAQLSLLVPIDRSDMIYAPTFTTETSANTATEEAADSVFTKRTSRPSTHASGSTTVILSEPSHMTEGGRKLWDKHTKGLPLNEPLDIFVPRLKSGVPDYLKEQHRDKILAQYNNAISRCLDELKNDNSLVHMTASAIKEVLTDFYITPSNFDLISDLQKAIDDDITSFLPLRSVGADNTPLTPQLMQKPEDVVRNILPLEDREKFDVILADVRQNALKVIETDEYYRDLDVEQYVKDNTVLQNLNLEQDIEPKSPVPYIPNMEADNPGITDPMLLKIYRERQQILQKSTFSEDSEDYDFDNLKQEVILTEREIDREARRLIPKKNEESGKLYTVLQDGTGVNTEVLAGTGTTGPTITNSSIHQTSTLTATGSVAVDGKTKPKRSLTTAELLAEKSRKLQDKFQQIIDRSKAADISVELTKMYEDLKPEDVEAVVSGPQVKQHIHALKKQGLNLLELEVINGEPMNANAATITPSKALLTSSSSGRSSAKPILTKSSASTVSIRTNSKAARFHRNNDKT